MTTKNISRASLPEQVAKMRPKRYLTSQAAEVVGRSKKTIERWRWQGLVVPSDSIEIGADTVFLYTAEDIKALKVLSGLKRPGKYPSDYDIKEDLDARTTKRKKNGR